MSEQGKTELAITTIGEESPSLDHPDLYRALLDSMTEGVSLSGEDGIIVYTNPAEDRLFGYDRGELIGQHVSVQNAYPDEENQRLVLKVIGRLKVAGHWEGEWLNRRKDGSAFVSAARITAVTLGGRTHFLCVQRDVTERDANARAVREREELLSAIFNQATAGFAQVDLAGRFTLVNQRFCEITGYTEAELLQRTMQSITHPDDLGRNVALFERAVADGTPYTHEKRYVRPDGSMVWVNNSVAVIRGPGGDPLGVLAVTLDVTERRRAEEALRRSEERVRLAVEGAGMATWELDLATMSGNWSSNRFEILGLAPSPTGEAPFDLWLDRVHPEDRARVEAAIRRCFGEGTPFEDQYRIIRADDRAVRWLESHGNRVGEAGAQRFVGVSFDITDRKRAEEHQRLLINELNHRVKNTLAIVQGLAQQSFGRDPATAAARTAFEGRLSALSAAHNVLTRTNWTTASLREIVTTATAPFGADRVVIDGPAFEVSPHLAVNLALALHELSTNAFKYGALTAPAGRVEIGWQTEDGRLRLNWRERDGPPVMAPASRGFGTRMIERGLAAELGGTVTIDFRADGVICTVDAPLPERS